jgi:pyruvate,water dikinase
MSQLWSARQLWSLGRKVSEYFGRPQDVEWAITGDGVFLVQSRPITTLDDVRQYHSLLREVRQDLKHRQAEGCGPWVRHNLGETLPHPTPLTWSVVRQFMCGKGGFGRMYRTVGFEPSEIADEQGFTPIGGRIYMDCSLMPEMFARRFRSPRSHRCGAGRRRPAAADHSQGHSGSEAAAARLCAAVTARLRNLAEDPDRRFDREFSPTCLNGAGRTGEGSGASSMRLIRIGTSDRSKSWTSSGPGLSARHDRGPGGRRAAGVLDEHIWTSEPDGAST